jgi:hypothetical protein
MMVRLLSRTFRSLKSPNPNPNPLKSSSSTPSKPRISLPKLSSRSWCVYLILSTNVPIKTYVGVTTDFPRRPKKQLKLVPNPDLGPDLDIVPDPKPDPYPYSEGPCLTQKKAAALPANRIDDPQSNGSTTARETPLLTLLICVDLPHSLACCSKC